MPVYRKVLLEPATYHTKQGPLRVTAEKIRDWYTKGKRMLAKGLRIPLPLNHQPTAKPSSEEELANRVKHNTGWTADYQLAGDTLYGILDVRDEATAKQLDNGTIENVSVEIEPFTDGDGESFGDAITHVALVTRPIAHRLEPRFHAVPSTDFQDVINAVDSETATATVGASQFAFGVGHPVRLGLDAIKEEKSVAKKPKAEKDEDLDLDTEEEETETPPPDVTDSDDAEMDKAKCVQEVVEKLREVYDLHLADDTNEENFWERAHAILTHEAGPDKQNKDGGADGLKTEEPDMPGGYMMSQDAKKPSPESLAVNKLLRSDRKRRLTECRRTGRMAPARAAKYLQMLENFQFSLDSDGEATTSEIDIALQLSEDLPEGAVFNTKARTAGKTSDKAQLGQDGLVEHEPPVEISAEAIEEAATKLTTGHRKVA